MNTLSSPRVVRVLDRLFAEADASKPAIDAVVAGTDVSAMITSRTGNREFYGLLKEIPLPVSRETGALLYALVRDEVEGRLDVECEPDELRKLLIAPE